MSSTRLPGKVLSTILGRPMIELEIERLKRSSTLQRIVVATSTDPSDDPLAEALNRAKIPVFRGSLEDVLDRYYRAAQSSPADHIVRLTGDCPLIDPTLVDQAVRRHIEDVNDYTSNRQVFLDGSMRHTFPHGTDTEVMTFAALERAWRDATSDFEREHVTPYIYRHPDEFRLGFVHAQQDRGSMRWTVDYEADLSFIRAIYERLYPNDPAFSSEDIFALLAREPELGQINAAHNMHLPASAGRGGAA